MWLLSRIDLVLRKASQLGFLAAAGLLLVVGLLGAADVISTNLLLRPIPGMVELSGALLAVIVFLGLAEAQARGSNIVIDIATQNMGPTARRLSGIFSLTLATAFMALVAWKATDLAASAWKFNETALGALAFPVAPFKTVACFGAWLSVAEFGRQLIYRIAGLEPTGETRNA
ncbi:TRAP transporter small permease subunit [Amorphus orientalis]|uniref:TRAP transporter small permease protein n=1 Tax=Amorphus orientalis TaxID=649198 RepID=A0AAE3VQB2_9HYPH|nr:TRAP transporter small permease [Amorphus orientalis]MDQ0315786.1 TRAP-type C4-dicarboxylate transport system permease small subunit [Amorphus orientalis]